MSQRLQIESWRAFDVVLKIKNIVSIVNIRKVKFIENQTYFKIYVCEKCNGSSNFDEYLNFLIDESETEIQIILGIGKSEIKLNNTCKHSNLPLMEIINPVVKIFLSDGVNFEYEANFESFGIGNISGGNTPSKNYSELIYQFCEFTELQTLEALWGKKTKAILVNKPEILFQDLFYLFCFDKFSDGRIDREFNPGKGRVDFLIRGKSLSSKEILLEMKWVGKAFKDTKNENDLTVYSVKQIKNGVSQLLTYMKSYNSQKGMRCTPEMLVLDAEINREAFTQIGTQFKNVQIYYAKITATSPSQVK